MSEKETPRSIQITTVQRRYLDSQSELLAGKGISECLEHARVISRINDNKLAAAHLSCCI